MRLNSSTLPDNIRRLMPQEAKTELGKSSWSQAEIDLHLEAKTEGEMHRQFIQWLNMRQIPFVTSIFGRKATIADGHPDFTILHGGKGFCVELKTENGQLSEAQTKRIRELAEAKVPVNVPDSG